MLAPSKETLQRIAGETGYQPGTIEKVLRLLDILQEISRDAGLRGQFALFISDSSAILLGFVIRKASNFILRHNQNIVIIAQVIASLKGAAVSVDALRYRYTYY